MLNLGMLELRRLHFDLKMSYKIDFNVCVVGSDGPKESCISVLDRVQFSHGKGKFWEKEAPIVKYRNCLLELCKNR